MFASAQTLQNYLDLQLTKWSDVQHHAVVCSITRRDATRVHKNSQRAFVWAQSTDLLYRWTRRARTLDKPGSLPGNCCCHCTQAWDLAELILCERILVEHPLLVTR